MATFVISSPKKDGPRNRENDKRDNKNDRRDQTGEEKPELETRYQKFIEKIKEEAEAANMDWVKAKKKPMEQQKPRKMRKQKRKPKKQVENSLRSRWTETVREADEELPEYRTQMDEEARSIVWYVGHDMDEKEKTMIGAACHAQEIVMEYKREVANEIAARKKYTRTQWCDLQGRCGN